MAQARAAVTAIGRAGVERARRAPLSPTRVTVEINEPRTGGTVASKTIVAASIDDAASMVAGYVARQIFVRDPTSPPWVYGAADGRDLGALVLARQERVFVESADDVRASRRRQVELLQNVTGADRCAGVVRYELASLQDLERDHLAALRLHAMNREQYPRFFRGTYRLCSSLEMIADPGFPVAYPASARIVLDETLDILYRAGLTDIDRCGPHDIHLEDTGRITGDEDQDKGPHVLSHELRETLLDAARRDLRTIRTQLSFPVVAWNTFWLRDERTVWRPHWWIRRRQEFRDGVFVAELLLAVKHRFNERYLVEKERALAAAPPAGAPRRSPLRRRRRRTERGASFAERLHQRKGLQVVTAIVGDATAVRTVLWEPFAAWPTAAQANPGQPAPEALDPEAPALAEAVPDEAARAAWIPPTRDRVRWLPWQKRTASWQAAYNAACLFAVLLQQGLAMEEQVIASLRRVVNNRDSGLERPYDWISNDPDFAPLLHPDCPHRKVKAFLEGQERRDYPIRQVHHHVTGKSGTLPTRACARIAGNTTICHRLNTLRVGDVMGLTSWIVWAILVVETVALGFVGFWFSVRTLRMFSGVTAFVLVIAVTRFGLTHPEYNPANIVDSFLSGVDQVAIALLSPLWPGQAPAPGVAGRWVIAVALLLGYRQLEAWALRWQAPELDLSVVGQGRPPAAPAGSRDGAARHGGTATAVKPTAAQRHAELAAELRFRLPSMEVRSPSILPGGTKANAVASIAETSGVSGSGVLSAAFRLAGMFWPGPRQLRVHTWVESDEGTPITVLIEDVKAGLPVATNTVTGDNFDEAASMVAGYITRQVFAMDRSVPGWCYGTADGRDLGAMQLARLRRVHAACPRDMARSRDEQVYLLSRSAGTVRAAGVVRYELAQLLALQCEHLESLRLHALNRELNPRLYRGRYRLAMSLEMITNPEHYLPSGEAAEEKLEEILKILARCRLTKTTLNVEANLTHVRVTDAAGEAKDCLRLSPELAGELLASAAKDLRAVRKQLTLWRVVRDVLFRRNERAVWLPHWRPRHRRAFRDGVCVAELLIAVRRKLLPPAAPGELPHTGWFERARDRWHLWRATGITSRIAGDPALIRWGLHHQAGQWNPEDLLKKACPGGRSGVRDRMLRLLRRRRVRSWQAAYNTACVYAALTDAVLAKATGTGTALAALPPAKTSAAEAEQQILKALETRVIDSLRQAIDNPQSELERPSDWIDGDPDFHCLSQHRDFFTTFERFLLNQKQQDYPLAFIHGECPVDHPVAASAPADLVRWLARASSRVISPVPGRPRVKAIAGRPGEARDRSAEEEAVPAESG